MRFETADGTTIKGHLYSTSGPKRKLVIFGHEATKDQTAWSAFAQELAARGVHTLTLDFRGFGETGGSRDQAKIDQDLEAAVRFMRSRDYPQIYLIGAGAGGTAALKVAARMELQGVVALTPTTTQAPDVSADLARITEPKLFIAGKADTSGAAETETLAKAVPVPVAGMYPEASSKGSDLLSGPVGDTVKARIIEFLGVS